MSLHKEQISPHGGYLVNRISDQEVSTRELLSSKPVVQLNHHNLADLECIATGVYSPLTGFVNQTEYSSIINTMRLPSGLAWTIPVSLTVSIEEAAKIPIDTQIVLASPSGIPLATMVVTSKFKPDKEQEALEVYRTTDLSHPGVRILKSNKDVYLGGPISLLKPISHTEFTTYRLTPSQIRNEFFRLKWHKVVAFQTRNPIHRAHEYITKVALETVDGLFMNPLVGATKSDDIPAEVRMKCYLTLIDNYFPRGRVVLGVFPAAMRYAGPREAIMHAIARQNYGCSHFIVGRDHAGVGSFYETYDAQDMFDQFSRSELLIEPIKFEHAFYCTVTKSMATTKTSPSEPSQRIHLSGTKVRELLAKGKILPPEFSRPEVAAILADAYNIQR